MPLLRAKLTMNGHEFYDVGTCREDVMLIK